MTVFYRGVRPDGVRRWSGVSPCPISDPRPEVEAPEELLADMPLPSDAKTFFLGSIFVLSMLAAAYVASEIVLPLIFAVAGKRPLGRGRATGPPRRKPDDRDGLALQRSGGTGSPAMVTPKRD